VITLRADVIAIIRPSRPARAPRSRESLSELLIIHPRSSERTGGGEGGNEGRRRSEHPLEKVRVLSSTRVSRILERIVPRAGGGSGRTVRSPRTRDN